MDNLIVNGGVSIKLGIFVDKVKGIKTSGANLATGTG